MAGQTVNTTPMNKSRKSDPKAPASREDRLGAALRANLARRKAQARVRADQAEEQQPDNGGASPEDAPKSEE